MPVNRYKSDEELRSLNVLIRVNRVELSDVNWGYATAKARGFTGSRMQFVRDAVLHWGQEVSAKKEYSAPERFFHE